eukprot:COSAG04_NODE_1306_length_7295_cov_3.324208_7_plen_76_part_00
MLASEPARQVLEGLLLSGKTLLVLGAVNNPLGMGRREDSEVRLSSHCAGDQQSIGSCGAAAPQDLTLPERGRRAQ